MLPNPKNGEKIHWILPASANMPNQSKISKLLIFWTIDLKCCMCLILTHTNIAILPNFIRLCQFFSILQNFREIGSDRHTFALSQKLMGKNENVRKPHARKPVSRQKKDCKTVNRFKNLIYLCYKIAIQI